MTKQNGNASTKVAIIAYVVIALTLGIVYACTNRSFLPSTDWDEWHLTGPVKALTVTEYDAVELDGQILVEDTLTFHQVRFAPDGRIESISEPTGTRQYTYTDSEQIITFYDIDGIYDGKEQTTYDAHHNIIRWVMVDDEGQERSREEYTYDARHRLKQKKVVSTDGANYTFSHYTFDAKGHITGYQAFEQDALSFAWQADYDAQGHKTEERWYNNQLELISTSRFEYNDHGLVSREVSQYYTCRYTYDYDSLGNYTRKLTTYEGGYDHNNYTIENRIIE